jgi:hypothetical protein
LSVSPSTVTLSIPATAFAGAPSNDTFSVGPGGVQTFRAATTATPTAGASVSLRVPALLAFRPESNVTAGDFNGQPGSFTIDAKTGAIVDAFFAGAATSSIMELSTTAADLGLPAANTSFNYAVASFSVFTGGRRMQPRQPRTTCRSPVPRAASSPRLPRARRRPLRSRARWLVVSTDDPSGAAMADEVPVGTVSRHVKRRRERVCVHDGPDGVRACGRVNAGDPDREGGFGDRHTRDLRRLREVDRDGPAGDRERPRFAAGAHLEPR